MPCGMLEIEEGPLAGQGVKLPVSLQIIGKWWGEGDVVREIQLHLSEVPSASAHISNKRHSANVPL